MNQQLATITARLNDIPSDVAKYLANTKTPISVNSSPSPSSLPEISQFPQLPQLDHNDFPLVVHWNQELYNSKQKAKEDQSSSDTNLPGTSTKSSKKSGKKVSSAGDSSTLSCWMEDENGQPIPEDDRSAARAKARSFWNKLFGKGIAPSCLGKADINIQDEYIALMEHAFPWLRYCKNHWKAKQLWSNNYSEWIKNAQKAAAKEETAAREKAAREKAEAEGEVIDVDASDESSQDIPGESSKLPRVDGETSEPKRR